MKNKIISLIAVLSLALVPLALPALASAACTTAGNTAKDQVLDGVGDVGGDCSGKGATNIFKSITKLLTIVVGAVAVIMIIVAGFKFITSSGDAQKVASAKNTIIYALVGLAVAVLAQVIVNVTIKESVDFGKCSTDSSILASDPNCKP